ncbi:hypothetical protein GCM10027275_33700 [Rhabdobacter roseus]|uniref:GAF domain-containing protein n=1 Tax=Rhabdobacter roseus TaxID=1655419 RepID=A0A840TUS7_9BACT|nr:GAF domain-containing protein [Rhabdobacter roseus]MBB5285407.1 hypothetical protein [Rhabdobacter roseus]
MEPLRLLTVSLHEKWQRTVEQSLGAAGYPYHFVHVASKQQALLACYQSRFDVLIANSTLPDGPVTDLVGVLGHSLPCVIMNDYKQGTFPLSGTAKYHVVDPQQVQWAVALQEAVRKWDTQAQVSINQHYQSDRTLYEKVLERCTDELTTRSGQAIKNVLGVLVEVLGVSRAYLCRKHTLLQDSDGGVLQTHEVYAPGVSSTNQQKMLKKTLVPVFPRWHKAFGQGKSILGLTSTMPQHEQRWLLGRDTQSMVAVPIYSKGSWDGFLALEDTMDTRTWTLPELRLLEAITELLAFHYEHKRLHLPVKPSINLLPYIKPGLGVA